MPTLSIDGTEYEVDEGRTVLQAIDDLGLLMAGVDIPHYCSHPKLSIDGSCRMCQVEVEGMPKLQIACNTLVTDGMVVRTNVERVQKAQRGVMELLLINHPLDCPICDQAGECTLQDYAFDYGMPGARTVCVATVASCAMPTPLTSSTFLEAGVISNAINEELIKDIGVAIGGLTASKTIEEKKTRLERANERLSQLATLIETARALGIPVPASAMAESEDAGD